MKSKIAVVGAGVGGLATAARLSSRGYAVDVYEKLDRCGGRNHMLEDKGFKFDMGPSFVLMPDFFEEAFSYCRQNIRDYLDLKPLDISYKIFYPDGDEITVFKDSQRTQEELERIEKGSSKAYERFLKEVGEIYDSVKPLLYRCFTRSSLFNIRNLSLVARLRPFETYWGLAKKFFKSEKLCYAFTFEAMFIGVSPFKTPAFYSVITYADHVQKIFHPMGGMYEIPKALEKMAVSFGTRFSYGNEVKSVSSRNGRVVINTEKGRHDYDSCVINADFAYARSELLGRHLPRYTYSCSVYLLYLGLKQKVGGFAHHNLFFSEDLRKNLRQIFDEKVMPEDPSFYVHVPTVTDPSLAPDGKEIFYILAPVPNLTGKAYSQQEYRHSLRKRILDSVSKKAGVDIEKLIEVEHAFYPQDFIARYNIRYGATFGLAHTLTQSAFFRPANHHPSHKNIYFVGASTQPGGGLPVVIASSRIVADLIDSKKQ